MTTLIVLGNVAAGAVRGPSVTVEGAALAPIALADGRFLLPLAVLDDIAHAAHRDFLASLPTVGLGEVQSLLPQAEDS